MRFKTIAFILLFALFFFYYAYLSYLNPDDVKFYFGGVRPLEMSVAGYVVLSFFLGIVLSIVVSFFFDVKTGIGGWISGRQNRKSREFKEFFDKAKGYDLKGEREKAIEQLQKLTKTSPTMEEPYVCLADMYVSMEDYDKAMETLNLGELNIGKNENILLKKIRVNLTAKEYVKNEAILKDVLKINESNIDALRILRDFYVWKKDWENAHEIEKKIKRFIKTDEENRRFIGIRYERTLTLFQNRFSQSTDKIIDNLKEIISEDKRFIPAYILLAQTYIKINKLNEAGRVYGRGYTKTGHIEFLLKMEDLYINRGDPGAILKIYQRVLDLSPKDHLITFLYARLCLRLEMIDEALDMLNSLIDEGEEFRGLHRAMAEAYIHREELDNAVSEFRKAFPMDEVYIPFVCTKCQAIKHEWTDFCESCSSWNTVNVKKEEFLCTDTPELRMIYDGEDWDRQYD
ncbi:MAG TPA: tetratricopeptide repeat protein [Syntrophorhabdaceae bacterium]|nr:tetratricopeptide repeat protein [Syntrophorhabdaceae bacterium]